MGIGKIDIKIKQFANDIPDTFVLEISHDGVIIQAILCDDYSFTEDVQFAKYLVIKND